MEEKRGMKGKLKEVCDFWEKDEGRDIVDDTCGEDVYESMSWELAANSIRLIFRLVTIESFSIGQGKATC